MINFQFIDLDSQAIDAEVPLLSGILYDEDRENVIRGALEEIVRRRKSGMKSMDDRYQTSRSINYDFAFNISCEIPYMPDVVATYNVRVLRRGYKILNAPYSHILVEENDPEIMSKIMAVVEETLVAQDIIES